MHRITTRIVLLIASASLLLALTGCPLPIDAAIAAQLADTTSPNVVILSPQTGDTYSQTVTLELQITDSAGSVTGSITGIQVEVSTGLTSLLDETVDPAGIDADGIISSDLQLSTQEFSGSIVIRVTVTDWNDNTAVAEVTLDDPGNDIPSFVVTPGSEQVALYWQDVPEASSYTVYYSTNGTIPSETYGIQIAGITESYTEASPLVISGLQNGSLHVFQLQADSDAGDSWYSDFVNVIPLSPFTVAPNVHAEFGRLVLQWQQIRGTTEFEVTRATAKDGPYINVSGVASGYEFVDEDVVIGTEYFYKVRPNVPGAIESAFAFGTPSPFAPDASRVLDFVDTPGVAGRLEISGDYAFVADYSGGLRVVDISDPDDLAIVSSLDDQGTFGAVSDLRIQGTLLYLARGGSGLQIVDISDPTAPQILSTTDIPTNTFDVAYDVALSGNYAFVSYVNYGIVVLDVSDPSAPTEVPGAGFSGSTDDIIVNGQYVYALNKTAGNAQFLVFDMGDVNNPNLVVDHSELIDGDGWELTLVGTTLLVSRNKTNEGAVEVWDVSTASDPVRTGVVLTPDTLRANDATLIGDVLYTASASSDYSITAHDISDLANPRLLFSVALPSGARGVRISGSYAFAGIGSFGLQAVDARMPPEPVLRNGANSFTNTDDIAVRGNYGFVANSSPGQPMLSVIDLTNPASPAEVAASSGNARGSGVVLRGDYAFVSGEPGLTVFDISDPLAPVALGEYETPGYASDVDLLGDFAVVADDMNGIQIVNVSDPTAPRYSQFVNTGRSYAVTIANGYAFVGATYTPLDGVHVIDMSSPLDATEVGFYSGFPAYSLSAGLETIAVSSDQTNGIVMLNAAHPEVNIDIGDAGAAAYITSYPPYFDSSGFFQPTPEGVALSGTYVFGVDWPEESAPGEGDGLHIFDVSDPMNGRLLLDVGGFSGAAGAWVYGSRLYVRDWSLGLMVIDM